MAPRGTRPSARSSKLSSSKVSPNLHTKSHILRPSAIPGAPRRLTSLAHAWSFKVDNADDDAQATQLLGFVYQLQEALPDDENSLLIRIQLLARTGKAPEALTAIRGAMVRKDPPANSSTSIFPPSATNTNSTSKRTSSTPPKRPTA